MNCDIERWKSFDVNSDDFVYSDILHRDMTFSALLPGPTYAQPLYVANGPGGTAAFIVVTEQDDVLALDATDGSQIWMSNLGAPVPRSSLPCGNIDPLGITGTPVIDLDARTVYVDAMTTRDGGATKQHLIYALSLDDGTTLLVGRLMSTPSRSAG